MALLSIRIAELAVIKTIKEDARNRFLLAALGAIATICFYPLIQAVRLGQIQVELTAFFIAACYAFASGKRGTAGFLVGMATLIKPQFSLFLLWGLMRRDWRFCIGWLAPTVIGFTVAVAKYGINWPSQYLDVLRYIGQHGESYYPNQSINGLLIRLLRNGNNEYWEKSFPPFHPVVDAGTLLSFILFTGVGLLYGLRSKSPWNSLDL